MFQRIKLRKQLFFKQLNCANNYYFHAKNYVSNNYNTHIIIISTQTIMFQRIKLRKQLFQCKHLYGHCNKKVTIFLVNPQKRQNPLTEAGDSPLK